MSGIHIRLIDGRVIVEVVDPGSPAARAGVCAGDALLQIDGTPIATHSLDQIRSTLQESPGRAVRLSVDRNGKQIEFTFHLSESFYCNTLDMSHPLAILRNEVRCHATWLWRCSTKCLVMRWAEPRRWPRSSSEARSADNQLLTASRGR